MQMIPSADVRSAMNRCGSARVPFLFAVDYEMRQGFVIEYPLAQDDVLWSVDGVGNAGEMEVENRGHYFRKRPVSESEYGKMFDVARQGLLRGDSFLLNLTVATEVEMDYSLEEIFALSHARYRLLVPGKFVCFSPESFVRISDGCISSFPMKGTISADVPDAENVILRDYKESAEHNTIVDLIRNDLNRVSTGVHVRRFRYIDRLHTSNGDILQVSSEVTGSLPDDYHEAVGDIIFDMLPAGSISGAPKESTVDIIRRAESGPRGFYTGVFGYYDGCGVNTAVMIRYIECVDGRMLFRSGGGITVNSSCHDEYNEVLQKVYLPFV